MLIDSSALVAVALEEDDAPALIAAIAADRRRLVAAPSLVEATAVALGRKGAGERERLLGVIARFQLTVVSMSPTAAGLAADAYARYGKGVGDPAVLNFGDCLAYGVARALGEPLLYTGRDFARTDLDAAPYGPPHASP